MDGNNGNEGVGASAAAGVGGESGVNLGSGIAGEGVNATMPTDWKSGLSEEFQGNESLSSYKDLDGLAKSHVELQKMLGNSVRIPGEDATSEDINKFHTKMGRPETAEAYDYKPSVEIPAELQNDQALAGFKQKAFEMGLSNEKFNEIASYYDGMNIDAFNAKKAEGVNADKEFSESMAATFGEGKQDAFNNASNVLGKYLAPEEAQSLMALDNKALVNVIKAIDGFSKDYVREDSMSKSGSAGNGQSSIDRLAEVRAELKTMDEFSPQAKALNDEKWRLLLAQNK